MGAELGSSCLPTSGDGTKLSAWEMSFDRRMQTKVPRSMQKSWPPSWQSVLIKVEMLCVLQETIWMNRSSPGTRISSLMPRA